MQVSELLLKLQELENGGFGNHTVAIEDWSENYKNPLADYDLYITEVELDNKKTEEVILISCVDPIQYLSKRSIKI